MNDERILGELKEFKRAIEKRMDSHDEGQKAAFEKLEKQIEARVSKTDERVEKVEERVEDINLWRAKRAGEMGVVAGLVSSAMWWFLEGRK